MSHPPKDGRNGSGRRLFKPIYDVQRTEDALLMVVPRTALTRRLVDPAGIEPATSCLQSRRSPG
jgi:hypothetical protein